MRSSKITEACNANQFVGYQRASAQACFNILGLPRHSTFLIDGVSKFRCKEDFATPASAFEPGPDHFYSQQQSYASHTYLPYARIQNIGSDPECDSTITCVREKLLILVVSLFRGPHANESPMRPRPILN